MLHFFDYDTLKQYVVETLCARADLDAGAPVTESPILKGGRVRGVEFMLFGGRSVRLSALWDADGGRIHYYDQNLVRFRSDRIDAFDPSEVDFSGMSRTRSVFAAK
jgi:hypothetical protein